MADRFWRGATNSTWDLTANWWTTIGGPTTGTPPGAADIAFFNANGTTTARNVYLNSSRSLGTFWMNGNAQGDITLLGGTSAVPATQTLTLGGVDMSGTSANAVFSSSVNVALANAQSWSIGSGRAISVSGIVSGAVKLTSNNSGVIILGNANTYSGGTDISAGTVRAGNNQALGTGAGSTITMTGGALSSDSTSARTLANALSLNGTMTLGDATNTGALTFSGTTTLFGNTTLTTASTVTLSGQLTGTGTLTKAGAGDLFLFGSGNTNSGAFTANNGSTYLAQANSGTPNQLGSVPSITIASGKLVAFNGNIAHSQGGSILGAGLLYVRNTAASPGVSFTGTTSSFTGEYRLYSDAAEGGASAQTMTFGAPTGNWPTSATAAYWINANTTGVVTQTFRYTGSGNVSASTPFYLYQNSGTGTPAVLGVLENASSSGATMALSGPITLLNTGASPSGTFQITVGASAGLVTLSGVIDESSTGTLNFEKTGAGAATLTGANGFIGTAKATAGTLNANSATALGAATSTAGISVSNGATLSLGGSTAGLTYASRNLTLFGGLTTNLVVANVFTNTFQSITASTASTLFRGTSSGTLVGPIACGLFAPTFSASTGNSLTVGSAITAATGMTIGVSGDTGVVKLSASNTIGNTSIAFGTAQASNTNAFGSTGTVTVSSGATLQTLTTGGQNGKLTVASLNNAAGGTIKIGG